MRISIVRRKPLEINKTSSQPGLKKGISELTSNKSYNDQHKINAIERATLEAERKKVSAINILNRSTFR